MTTCQPHIQTENSDIFGRLLSFGEIKVKTQTCLFTHKMDKNQEWIKEMVDYAKSIIPDLSDPITMSLDEFMELLDKNASSPMNERDLKRINKLYESYNKK